MGSFLAAVCGLLVGGGVVAAVAGWRDRTPGRGRSSGAVVRRFGTRRLALAGAWLVAGVMAASLTGWVLLVPLVPVLGVGLPVLLGRPDPREADLLQALDRWVRALVAILPTGRSVPDAIRVSVRQAPAELDGPLRLSVERLDDGWTLRQALYAMADELDSADADAVIAALVLAAERGGTGAQATLAALADAVQDRLRALREIAVEREKPRLVVRQVSLIMVVVLAGAVAFGGSFFAPYGTPEGQVILGVLVVAYLGSLLVLRRMAMPPPRRRVLGAGP